MVVARSHARDDGVDKRPPCAGRTFTLDNDHSPAFAQYHPVSFGVEGAGGFMCGPFLPGQPEKGAQGGEFQKMHTTEILLAPSDDGCIDDAGSDHLDGAVKCDQ